MRPFPRIFLWCLLAWIAPARAGDPAKQIYVVRYHSDGWETGISVNGVPLLKGDPNSGQAAIENMVVNGANQITIAAKQTDGGAQPLEVAVLLMDAATGKETTVSQFTGTPGKAGTTAGKTIDFQAAVPMQWAWEKADDVKALAGADRDEIYQQVRILAQCLNAKDLKTHNKLRAVFLDETAQFEKLDRERVQAMSDAIYQHLFDIQTSPWLVRERDQLDIVSYGRITVVSAKAAWPDNWTITLKLTGEQDYSFRELWFAKIDGKWIMIN